MTNPIEAAVAPLKKDAIDRAAQEALKLVSRVTDELKEHNFDAHSYNPLNRSISLCRLSYARYKQQEAILRSMTEQDKDRPYSGRPNDPYYVVMSGPRIDAFIESCKLEAAMQYDAFVAKLCAKIGAVEKAEISGNHVWSRSVLTVTKADASVERWATQQIVNVSKLGKLFNQWPTRKTK